LAVRVNVRRLVPADAHDYRALMLEAYLHHPDAFTSTPGERAGLPIAWWQSRLAEGPTAGEVVVGAFDGDDLGGVAGIAFESREKTRHKCTLFGMYVADRLRRSGIGRELVAAALRHVRMRSDVRIVVLTVTQGNDAAQRLYEQCGFAAFGTEPFAVAVGARFVSKVHMWQDLGWADLPRHEVGAAAPLLQR
jgi:ribosomal protein S18 acetylase RimI-like enzyme